MTPRRTGNHRLSVPAVSSNTASLRPRLSGLVRRIERTDGSQSFTPSLINVKDHVVLMSYAPLMANILFPEN
jgi:hypothetical protein